MASAVVKVGDKLQSDERDEEDNAERQGKENTSKNDAGIKPIHGIRRVGVARYAYSSPSTSLCCSLSRLSSAMK